MIKVILLLAISFIGIGLFAQKKNNKSPMPWLSVEEALLKMEAETRPVLIDVYTDWCHYCKIMDNTLWQQKDVTEYVANYFYPIKFNAESKAPVVWMGATYEFKPAYKVHMLAAEWLQGNMIYPSTVILPPDGDPIVVPGVLTKKELEPILKYFGEKHYLITEWQSFKTTYKPLWK